MAAKRQDLRVGRAGLLNRRTDEAGSREYVALSRSAAMTEVGSSLQQYVLCERSSDRGLYKTLATHVVQRLDGQVAQTDLRARS